MPFQPTDPQSYRGVRAPTPINLWTRNRDPNAQDFRLYLIGDLWYNSGTNAFWILIDTGSFGALWVVLNTSVAQSILTINGISPTALGNFTLVAGTNITLVPGVNSLTINSTGGGIGITTWVTISASQALAVNTGYICIAPGGPLSLSLPAVSVLGDEIEITLDGSASFVITQGVGQQIRIGNLQTALGVGGTLTSSAQGDTLRMVCQMANTKWNVLSSFGNLTPA